MQNIWPKYPVLQEWTTALLMTQGNPDIGLAIKSINNNNYVTSVMVVRSTLIIVSKRNWILTNPQDIIIPQA